MTSLMCAQRSSLRETRSRWLTLSPPLRSKSLKRVFHPRTSGESFSRRSTESDWLASKWRSTRAIGSAPVACGPFQPLRLATMQEYPFTQLSIERWELTRGPRLRLGKNAEDSASGGYSEESDSALPATPRELYGTSARAADFGAY